MSSPTPLHEMIPALIKTFAVGHEANSDEHLAQALVYNAGRLAWRLREAGLQAPEQKTSVSDIVTEADKAAEAFVAGVLELVRPADGVLGEEGTQRPSESGKTWVIDPVDGTYNFASGSDYFCSAVALVSGSPADPTEVHFGAVHRPAMGYTWFGGPNVPSTKDGKPLTPLVDKPLNMVSLGTYIHPSSLADLKIFSAWNKVATRVATLRMLGAGSIDLATVADGGLGVWLQHSVADWDWLPGQALVAGVGGLCQRVAAGGVTWSVAGNHQAATELIELLQG